MKTICKIEDCETGAIVYCLKKRLELELNIIEGEQRAAWMSDRKLTPLQAALRVEEMNDAIAAYMSDAIEVTEFENEEELIADLN